MDSKQILIKCGKNWFEFSKSRTGQLDYAGKVADGEAVNVEGYQKIESSAYFSLGQYLYIQDEMNCSPVLFVSPKTDISDKDSYEFLLHAGALLCAAEAKNAFLAGKLYWRRRNSFAKCARLAQFIMRPLAAEILFCLVYGQFRAVSEEDVPLIFDEAKKSLGFNPAKETLEQAFVRYFKEKKRIISLPVVGTNYYHWSPYSEVLENLFRNITPDAFENQFKNIYKAKRSSYANLSVAVQAEPYNPADKNAVTVMIENIDAKLAGNSIHEKAGYIRAAAAQIIRAAKPEVMAFPARLVQLSEQEIAVEIEV
ncbi:MAG: hypothetical protein NC041_07620 [Bacteroides sp.]|nr:hypothetical protein [Prevotella sp.]MCM1407168.1 hypothetical protein [Treponema brennaborense]MCM1470320.1 hypothetical protein [Bacteroides sp.]